MRVVHSTQLCQAKLPEIVLRITPTSRVIRDLGDGRHATLHVRVEHAGHHARVVVDLEQVLGRTLTTCYPSQKCTSKGIRRKGIVLKHRSSLQRSLYPVVVCPYLCSSDLSGHRQLESEHPSSAAPSNTAPCARQREPYRMSLQPFSHQPSSLKLSSTHRTWPVIGTESGHPNISHNPYRYACL